MTMASAAGDTLDLQEQESANLKTIKSLYKVQSQMANLEIKSTLHSNTMKINRARSERARFDFK